MLSYFLGVALIAAVSVESYPYGSGRGYPHRALMFSGYYGQPSKRSGYDYYPASMSAFLSGDTVSTGTFSGDSYVPAYADVDQQETQEVVELLPPSPPAKKKPEPQEAVLEVTETPLELTTLEELEATTPAKPKSAPRRKNKPQTPAPEEQDADDEEEGNLWPFRSGRYNAFFPIILGGYSGSKGRSPEEGGYPGAATAIANSFSTGKGGVASSHATAFGDPSLSALFRNGRFNFRKASEKENNNGDE